MPYFEIFMALGKRNYCAPEIQATYLQRQRHKFSTFAVPPQFLKGCQTYIIMIIDNTCVE